MPGRKPLPIGQKFGRLKFIKEIEPKNGRRRGLFECDCGKILENNIAAVRCRIRSCGCLRLEKALIATRKHGHCRRITGPSKTYTCWQSMLERCTNPNVRQFHLWG